MDPCGLFTARLFGTSPTGTLLLTWYAKEAEKSIARRAVILELFIYDAIGFIVTITIVFSGVLIWIGWGIVGVYLFFTVGFGYYWLKVAKE